MRMLMILLIASCASTSLALARNVAPALNPHDAVYNKAQHKILLVGPQWTSHLHAVLKVGTALARRGHTILAIFPDTLQQAALTYTASQFEDGTIPPNFLFQVFQGFNLQQLVADLKAAGPIGAVRVIARYNIQEVDTIVHNATLMQAMRSFNATLSVSDEITQVSWVLPEVLGMPFINIDHHGGGPTFSWPALHGQTALLRLAYVPAFGSKLPGGRMSLGQRTSNLLSNWLARSIMAYAATPQYVRMRQELGLLPLEKARQLSILTLVNGHQGSVNEPFAAAPQFKFLGPLLPAPAKDLPAELAAFVTSDAAKDGLVLVSMGSGFDLPPEALCCISHALLRVGKAAVWKLGADSEAWLAANCSSGYGALKTSGRLHVMRWLPQNDLLGHSSVVAFFTHGGLNGIFEGAYHGKPLVVVPIAVDQFDHAANVERRIGMGRAVQVSQLLVPVHGGTGISAGAGAAGGHACGQEGSAAVAALRAVLEEPKHRQAAQTMSRRLQAISPAPDEQAADWVEYAIATGLQPFLHTLDAQLPWWELYMVDVVGLLALALVAAGLCIWAAAKFVMRLACGHGRLSKHSKEA